MKKLTHNIKFALFFCALFTLGSCKKFLEQEPDNRTTVTTKDQVTELLVSAYPKASYFPFTEPMSDNAEDKGFAVQGFDPDLVRVNQQSFFYQDVQATGQDSPEGYWDACYKAIATANHALQVIENSPDKTSMNAQKGEALVARAYAHFMLVTLFAKAYDPATAATDPGVPYVTEPEKVVFGQYDRKTVQSVYDAIEADLNAGISLIEDKSYGSASKFHFTLKAAHGFASRFYLFKRNYAKVVQEANLSITSGSNVAAEMRPWNPTYVNYQPADIRLAYTASTETANILLQDVATSWESSVYFGLRYGLSNDVYTIVLNGPNPTGGTLVIGYRTFGADPRYYNVPKFIANNGYSTETLITSEEVLFNRAEANLNLKNYTDVLTDLNAWASRNIRNYNANTHNLTISKMTSFWGQSQDQAILSTILLFRRAFFIHEGMRWLDILRLKIPVTHRTTDGKVFNLAPDDNRRMLQLPLQATLSGLPLNPR